MATNHNNVPSADERHPIQLDSIESALADFSEGKMVIVVDEIGRASCRERV